MALNADAWRAPQARALEALLRADILRERERWGAVIRAANIRAE